MNRNLIGFAIAVLCFSNVSHADFVFRSQDPKACDYISHNWAGAGKAYNWFIGTCKYHGYGTISPLDSTGHFSMEVTADKDSGSILCPEHSAQSLTGTCINGVVTFITEYGNIAGNFSPNTGSAQGILSASPGMNIEVSMQFHRVD